MTRRVNTASLLLLACALAAGLAALATTSLAQSKPQLAGKWNFNQDQSDDAGQKVQDAEASAKSQGGGYPGGGGSQGGGYPGGGYPGGGGVGFPGGRGGMGGGGMGRGGRGGGGQSSGLASEDMEQLSQTPKLLLVEQNEQQITFTSDTGQVKTLYPDGKKHKEKDSSGESTTYKTSWNGNRLVAESKLHSGKLTETYELSGDGKQLVATSELDNSRLSTPLVIRRVYDRGGASSK